MGRLFNKLLEGISAEKALPPFAESHEITTPKSSFKLIEAVGALLRCDELQGEHVSESTHQLIEGVLETVGQVRRECEFAERSEIIEFFAKRFAEENKEMLGKRVVALVGTLSNEELYSSFEGAREMDRSGGKDET